jgi:putative hemolysin
MTFLILVFGEITPKTLAKEHAENISLFIIRPLYTFSWILSPLTKFFLFISTAIIRSFGGKGSPQASRISEEEILSLVKAGEREGVLEKKEREMIYSVIEFGDKRVDEVMTPRTEIVAVREEASLEEILEVMIKDRHSRIPVYREDMDEICGIVHVRNLLSHINPVRKEGFDEVKEEEKELRAREVMEPAYFIPESKRLSDLLHEFQRQKNQIAIVIDEHGGTAGLVTLKDLLEEIIGEISDRYEKETPNFQVLEDNTFLVNGKMEIEKANKEMGLEISEEIEAETIAGFVLHQLGRIPKEGEQFKYKNLLVTIQRADERSVSLLRIKKFIPKEKQFIVRS